MAIISKKCKSEGGVMNSTARYGMILLLVFVAVSQVYAQDDTEKPVYRLDEITVSAPPVVEGTTVTRYGESTTIVGSRQVDELNAQDLPSALRRVPGVSISRYNMIGSYGGGDGGAVYVRGHGSARPGGEISTMIDGIARFNGIWTHPLMDLMSIDIADRIEVQKSARPVTNGNMSFSAINLHTKRILSEGFQSRFQSSFGTYNTVVQRLEHGGKKGGLDYYISGTHRQSDGHRVNANGEVQSLYGRIGYRIDEHWDASLMVNAIDSWALDPQPVGTVTPPITEKYPNNNKLYIGTINHNHGWARGTAKLYMDDGYANWRQWDDEADTPEQENGISDYRNYGIKLKETLNLWDGGEILGGIDVDRYGGSFVSKTPDNPGDKLEQYLVNTSPYMMVSHEFGDEIKIIPSAGVRYTASSEFDNQAGYQGGLVMRHEKGNIRANYARSFNYPGVYTALFYSQYWSFAYEGDEWKDLDAEKLDHVEIGGTYNVTSGLSIDLSYFHDDVTNALRMHTPPPPPPSWQNIGEYTVQGIETSVKAHLFDSLDLFGGGSFLDVDPTDTPNAPEISISTGAGYTLMERIRLNLDAEYIDEQYVQGTRTPDDIKKIDDYTLVNLRAGYLFGFGENMGELFVSIENILDEEYEYRPGYPMPGRTFTGGFDLRM